MIKNPTSRSFHCGTTGSVLLLCVKNAAPILGPAQCVKGSSIAAAAVKAATVA